MIYLSKSASQEILRLQANTPTIDSIDSGVRLSIAPGGCAGWYYDLGFAGEVGMGDRLYDCEGISVIVDAHSLEHLQGVTIDYSADLMGGGFRFDNPQATNICSCGNSFALKSSD